MDWTWDSKTLRRALEIRLPSSVRWPQFSFNSVNLIPGERSSGSLFVPAVFELTNRGYRSEDEALQAAIRYGASAAITNLCNLSFRPTIPVIQVQPTLAALVKLAQFARQSYRGKIIAITGSVGKTTTKDLIHHVLSHAGLSFKTQDNHNSLGGICEVTINRPLKSQFTVVEVGASQPGHMQHAKVARPHIGIITNVGVSHLSNYRQAEDILREKVALFDHLEGDRVGIVHRSVLEDDDARDRLIRSKGLTRLLTVGNAPGNDIFLTEATFDGTGSEATMSVFGVPYRFRLPFPGRHFLDSAMFATAVVSVLGLDIDPLMASLATAEPPPRRLARYRVASENGIIELLDDSHNASPNSVAALLATLECRAANRKVLVFGDMFGLGSDSARFHKEIACFVNRSGVDLLVTVGALAHLADPGGAVESENFADAEGASAAMLSLLKPGDLVAVKGSGEMRLDKVVKAIQKMGESRPATTWKIEHEYLPVEQQAPDNRVAT